MKGDLKKASALYKRGKYPQVIRLLEPQIFRFRQSYNFFFFVGMSCLHTGDLGGASTYLQRGLGLQPNDIPANLGLAIVHLKRQETQEAIRCYLEILESDPGNSYAKRGLGLLRRDATPDRLLELDESGRLLKLLPGKRVMKFTRTFVSATLVAAAAFAVIYLWQQEILFSPKILREPAVERLSLADIGEIVDLSGNYRYLLTEKEIDTAFTDAKKHFSQFEDNLAQIEINRLLGSNASVEVKEQTRVIESYITEPNFTTLKDSFGFAIVEADPFLYANTYINWKGKLSNLAISSDLITFDLLVGYETNEVLLGIVPVVLDFAALLNQGEAVEILGKVSLNDSNGFFLQCISIHKLIPEG
jgi:tetratricopeptide (TPR) repeat protein